MGVAEGRILVADDEDSLRWVLEKGFRGAGYQVTAVKDGTAALAEAESQPFDLILLDVRMPGIDGLELQRRIRLARPTLPVIFISAHGDDAVRNRALEGGAIAFLDKPFDASVLLAAISEALPGRPQRSDHEGDS